MGSMEEDTVPVDIELLFLHRQRMVTQPPRGVTVSQGRLGVGLCVALIVMALVAVLVSVAAGVVF